MPLILGTNSIKDTGYDVANSVKFNDDNNDSLNRTLGTPTNNFKWSISFWIKRTELGVEDAIMTSNTNAQNRGMVLFRTDDSLDILDIQSDSFVMQKKTNRKFRDASAWYSILISSDATLSSPATKLYVNGVEETSFATTNEYTQNQANKWNSAISNHIGNDGSARDGSYYLAEFVFVDGQVLTPTDIGEFDQDSGIWKPIDVSGLTFGNNGFYLDFEDSSALGADVSGNSNNFTVNNLTATDQYTDTCTNNFAVLNPLHQIGSNETSQGNLEYSVSNHHRIISTIAPTKGKWYAEVQGVDSPAKFMAGVSYYPIPANGSNSSFAFGMGVNADVGRWANDFGVRANGDYGNDNSYSSFMSTPGNNDIIGIYMDLDNYKLYMSLNGSLVSSTGKDLTNNGKPYGFISVGEAGTFKWNFGNPSFTVSSGNTDDEGFGNFEFSPNITGDGASKSFFALCTKNLAEYG
jgi:hypothetical protein